MAIQPQILTIPEPTQRLVTPARDAAFDDAVARARASRTEDESRCFLLYNAFTRTWIQESCLSWYATQHEIDNRMVLVHWLHRFLITPTRLGELTPKSSVGERHYHQKRVYETRPVLIDGVRDPFGEYVWLCDETYPSTTAFLTAMKKDGYQLVSSNKKTREVWVRRLTPQQGQQDA